MSGSRNVLVGALMLVAIFLLYDRLNKKSPLQSHRAQSPSKRAATGHKATGHRAEKTSSPTYDSDHVRECVSGQIIGKVPRNVAGEEYKPVLKDPSDRRMTNEEAFIKVFKTRQWRSRESHSGYGSEISFTHEIMSTLNVAINFIKDRLGKDRITMIDIPCGDMNWMKRFLEMRSDIIYTGVDIVPDLVTKLKTTFVNTTYTFMTSNIVKDGFKKPYDLIFSRMMTQHLPDADAEKMLQLSEQSGSKFLLTTTFPFVAKNLRMGTAGGTRPINFELPPFSLHPPLCLQLDGPPKKSTHFMGLWQFPLKRVSGCTSAQEVKRFNSLSCVDWGV